MDWITERIAIGTKEDGLDRELIRANGIRSVLNLHGKQEEAEAHALGLEAMITIPLLDGSGNDPEVFRRAVDTLAELVAWHAPVLVHCNLGVSRSPAVVSGYLVRSTGLTPGRALSAVADKRAISVCLPLQSLVHSLVEGFVAAKLIEVRLLERVLLAFEGPRQVFTFGCVIGDASHPTPPGTWTVLGKHRHYLRPRSHARLFNALPFTTQGEAIHQAPPNAPLSVSHPGFMPVGPSGCVQLSERDAAALYEWTPVGTRVWVH